MTLKSIFQSIFAMLALAIFAVSCSEKDNPLAGEFKGEEATFGFGKVYTYVINDEDGNPQEIGVAMNDAAFDNFSQMSGDDQVSIDFPKEADQTPFKHQFMGFASHGHEPLMFYGLPHFDLHFYTSTEAERTAIMPFDTVKAALVPGPDYFPTAFFPAGLVPQMGVHWIDPTSPEFNGQLFTQTFIWGSFDGKVTFLEPMITKAFIAANHHFEADIKQPAKYDQPGKYYPTKQGFHYDEAVGERRFYLKGFVKR